MAGRGDSTPTTTHWPGQELGSGERATLSSELISQDSQQNWHHMRVSDHQGGPGPLRVPIPGAGPGVGKRGAPGSRGVLSDIGLCELLARHASGSLRPQMALSWQLGGQISWALVAPSGGELGI